MGGLWAPKPAAGPHKQRECLPVAIILRDRLKYALTNKECMQICMERCVKVDGKVRTEANFPTGFMDIVELEKSGDVFRVMLDVKGRFVLHRVNKDESAYKLCKVTKSMITNNKVPVVVTHDGRTIRYPDPDVKANDTIKVDLATGKMSDIFKFTLGATVMITKGHNAGRVGHLMHIEKHDGSFSIATVKDAKGNSFSTRLQNVFVIGNGDKAEVSLPKGKGIKKTIIETRSEMESRGFL
jgi:small subunit ribosomal protein S4e